LKATTDATGHASVGFRLGPSGGNHVVEANFEGNPGLPAALVAIAVEPKAGSTSFVGVVQDNSQQPIKEASCELIVGSTRLTATTDDKGAFSITGIATTGPGHLKIDGGTATVNLPGGAPITIPVQAEGLNVGDPVTLGVRPEHMMEKGGGDAQMPGNVFVVERLGGETFLYIRGEGDELRRLRVVVDGPGDVEGAHECERPQGIRPARDPDLELVHAPILVIEPAVELVRVPDVGTEQVV